MNVEIDVTQLVEEFENGSLEPEIFQGGHALNAWRNALAASSEFELLYDDLTIGGFKSFLRREYGDLPEHYINALNSHESNALLIQQVSRSYRDSEDDWLMEVVDPTHPEYGAFYFDLGE